MSAGTGIKHSEYNDSSTEAVNFLEIWILPKKRNIEPRYKQKTIDTTITQNRFMDIVSPCQENNNAVWINQDAYLSLSSLEKASTVTYKCNYDNPAIYVFVISGKIVINQVIIPRNHGQMSGA